MSTLISLNMSKLRKEEILGFCQEVADRIADVKMIADSDVGKAFIEQILSYSGELDASREIKSKHIEDADAAVDAAVAGLRAHLQALLTYPRESVREAARSVWIAIEQYGSPVRLSYNEEYAIVARMLGTLEVIDANVLATATVDAWVPALRERYDAFMALRKDFSDERAELPAGRIKAMREELAEAWKTLSNYLNGLAVVQPTPELTALIDALNVKIQTKKTTMKARKSTKKTDAEAAIEPVDIES